MKPKFFVFAWVPGDKAFVRIVFSERFSDNQRIDFLLTELRKLHPHSIYLDASWIGGTEVDLILRGALKKEDAIATFREALRLLFGQSIFSEVELAISDTPFPLLKEPVRAEELA